MAKITDIKDIQKKAWRVVSKIGPANHWDEYFESEQELIDMMMALNDSQVEKVSGNYYIKSFRQQVSSGKTLSIKQMSMLKRCAWNIIFIYYDFINKHYD